MTCGNKITLVSRLVSIKLCSNIVPPTDTAVALHFITFHCSNETRSLVAHLSFIKVKSQLFSVHSCTDHILCDTIAKNGKNQVKNLKGNAN